MPDNQEIKRQICKYIFKSDYFRDKHEKSVNPEKWRVKSELEKKQNALYKAMFVKTGKKSWSGDFEYEYRNRIRRRTI